jgi:hypothetical protein
MNGKLNHSIAHQPMFAVIGTGKTPMPPAFNPKYSAH